jgi:hypothetical protein
VDLAERRRPRPCGHETRKERLIANSRLRSSGSSIRHPRGCPCR